MRLTHIAGAVLIVLGLWVIVRPPSYSRQVTVFKVGNVEATMPQQQTVPAWVGGAALGAGALLLVLGLLKR